MLDVANRRWSAEVLHKTEIDQRLLPTLYESSQVCGKVSAAGLRQPDCEWARQS